MSQLGSEIESFKSSLASPRPPVSVAIDAPVTVKSGVLTQPHSAPERRWLVVLLVLMLAVLGALLWAQLRAQEKASDPATVLVVQSPPAAPDTTTVVASASFSFPSFPSGESCVEPLTLPAADRKRLSAFLESALCHSAGYDAWTIVGGHDSQDLKPATRTRFKSNPGLAYDRASCIKRHFEIVAEALDSKCSRLPSTLVIAAKPNSTEPLPHSEQVKTADRGGLVIFYKAVSGEAP